jgi:selenocysteine lyase/cysteine desulfurase
MGAGNWTRRDFLRRSGAAAAVGAATLGTTACTADGDDGDDQSDDEWDPSDWASVRDQFPLRTDRVQLAAFVLAAHPRPVQRVIDRYRDGLDHDTQRALGNGGEYDGDVRRSAVDFFGGAPEHIALTDSTTMGLGLLYGGLRLSEGDEVLTTEHDFYATHEALRLRTVRDRIGVRRVRLYDEPARADVDEIVERLVDGIRPETRAVALTWVHSSTGVKLPIAHIARALRQVNEDRAEPDHVLLCVDGVHGVGAQAFTPEDMGCDFLVSGTHKWLFGPRGTGIVWGRPAAWARVDHLLPSFSPLAMEAWIAGSTPHDRWPGELATPGGYHSFEHRWALAETFRFHALIGTGRIARRTTDQATRLKDGLAELDGVEVVTPRAPELSAGIVCVDVAGRDPHDLAGLLHNRNVVASVTPYAQPYLRFGPSIVTTPDEMDQTVDTLSDLL